MRVQLRLGAKLASKALKEHVKRKLHMALDRFSQSISTIQVHVDDLNGPQRGGEDKHCRIFARLPAQGELTTEASSPDAYSAVDQAADTMKLAVARRVGKAKRKKRVAQRKLTLKPA